MAKSRIESIVSKARQISRAQVALVILGVGLLLLSSLPWWHAAGREVREAISHLIRDIGIAFLISVIVAYLIELERDLRHLMNIKSDTVRAEMEERLTPSIWSDLDNILQEKKLLRENIDISLSITTTADESVLEIDYRYDLRNILTRPASVRIEHELDYQLQNEQAGLPCFDRILIDASKCGQGDFLFEAESLKTVVRNGRFQHDLQLPERGHSPVVVYTVRRELVHIPGSYNLYMPEFCKGLRLQVRDCPPNVAVDVVVRPQGSGQLLKRIGNTWSYDHLILPGQGLEMKFTEN